MPHHSFFFCFFASRTLFKSVESQGIDKPILALSQSMKFDSAVLSLVMAQVLFSLLGVSKNASIRLSVRAFTIPSVRRLARPHLSSTNSIISPSQSRFFTAQVQDDEPSTKLAATVEDDLDSALDDLFSDSFAQPAPTKTVKKVKSVESASSFFDDEEVLKVRASGTCFDFLSACHFMFAHFPSTPTHAPRTAELTPPTAHQTQIGS